MPIKTGTRQLRTGPTKQLGLQPGAKVDTKSKGAPRTMRCKACGGQAMEASDRQGGVLLRCGNCKREYKFAKM
jgi:hypothetical protein